MSASDFAAARAAHTSRRTHEPNWKQLLADAEGLSREALAHEQAAPASHPHVAPFVRGSAVVAAHFSEIQWLTALEILAGGGLSREAFGFIDDESLDATRANIAASAVDAGDRAYWADENAISIVQRYLRVRLLIFNPAAAAANQCTCTGDLQEVNGSQGPIRYVILRHTHRSNKLQHYELFTLGNIAVFDENTLPPGVGRAFAAVCPSLATFSPAEAMLQ